MNNLIYNVTYMIIGFLLLLMPALSAERSKEREQTDSPLLELKQSKKIVSSHSMKEIPRTNFQVESKLVKNYRDMEIVVPESDLANSFPHLLRLDAVLNEIKSAPNIYGVDLGKNPLSDQGTRILTKALDQLPSLGWVDLSFTEMNLEGLKLVVNLLNRNMNIKYISVASNPVTTISSRNYFITIDVDLLKRLVVVGEDNLYTDSLDQLLKGHPQYNLDLIHELRESYEGFFKIKTGKDFDERYLSYNEAEDLDGEVALKFAAQMVQMQRYNIAKDFCLKAIAKGNGRAASYLATQYDRGHLKDEKHGYRTYLKKAIELKYTPSEWEYLERHNRGTLGEISDDDTHETSSDDGDSAAL